jgi:hypothetical protein
MCSLARFAVRAGACLTLFGATVLAVSGVSQKAFAAGPEATLLGKVNLFAGSGLAQTSSSPHEFEALRTDAPNRRSRLGVAAAAAGYQCAVNSFEPKRIGVRPHFRVQGRAVNICTGDVIRQAVVLCVNWYGSDKIWHGDICSTKSKRGPGTIDFIISGPCLPGIRRYRTESFGSVTTSHGTFVSDLDNSRNTPIVCV